MLTSDKNVSEGLVSDRLISLEGIWHAELSDGTAGKMRLPGTLDENCLGHRDHGRKVWHPDQGLGNAKEGFREDAPIATRFTRKYTYEGEARALLASIYQYLDSEEFAPEQEMTIEEVAALIK